MQLNQTGSTMGTYTDMSPSDIFYTQKSIKNTFRNGKTLKQVIEGIKNGTISVERIPNIRVVTRYNKWWSLDNRRLCVFKSVQSDNANFKKIRVRQVAIDEFEWKRKFTTKNGGTTISIRGEAKAGQLLGGAAGDPGEDYDSEDDWDEAELNF